MLSSSKLRHICEIVDPQAIIALDEPARLALIDAFCSEKTDISTTFAAGAECRVLGRHLLSVNGFEPALNEEDSKQKAWAQLKRCVPPSVR